MNKKKRRKRLYKANKRRSKLIKKNNWLKAWNKTKGKRFSRWM